MSGNKQGAKTTASTNRAKYGADFYKVIGALGGKKGHTGGFYANRKLAHLAGRKGGLMSTRKKNMTPDEKRQYQDEAIAEYNRLTQAFDDDTQGIPINA